MFGFFRFSKLCELDLQYEKNSTSDCLHYIMTKATLSFRTHSEFELVTSQSVANWPDWATVAYSDSNYSNLSLFDMALTRYEEDLVDNQYDPSLRMTFLCCPSSKIPKVKEWKLIQRATTSQQLRFYFPNVSVWTSVFPTPWLLFGLPACIRENSKAVVTVFKRGPKLLKVERQTPGNTVKLSVLHFSVNAAAHSPQRAWNSCYLRHYVIIVPIFIFSVYYQICLVSSCMSILGLLSKRTGTQRRAQYTE